MRTTSLPILYVRTRAGYHSRGWLIAGAIHAPVALGRSGIRANKREGDGATPRGCFKPVRLWWRADRIPHPQSLLPTRRIGKNDGWCENPADRQYNRPIAVKGGSADRLWRADRLYDLIIELDHNTRPRIAGRGSAVFIHVARPGFAPTAGCVALEYNALRQLIKRIDVKTRIDIQ